MTKEFVLLTQLLSYKLLKSVTRTNVQLESSLFAERCVAGVQMAWACYLLNEFVDDCLEAQDFDKEFHYSWVILLIAMILWSTPPSGHEEDASVPPFVMHLNFSHYNIQRNKKSRLHHKSFQKWYTQLIQATNSMLHIPEKYHDKV
jgi:hypothetical protein